MPIAGYRRSTMMTGKVQTDSSSGQSSKYLTAPVRTNFRVEHLASFPLGPGDKVVSAKERVEKAKELITKGEPWTKEMELSVTDKEVVLLDCETKQLIERYPLSHVDSVQDVSDDPLLSSVLVFSTTQTQEKYAAVHLFQCDKIPANVIAPEIQKLLPKSKHENPKMNGQVHGVPLPVLPPPPDIPAPLPPQTMMDLKERSLVAQGVAAFSAAVAHKENSIPRPPSSPMKIIHGERYGEASSPDLMEAYINRDVQILNHCIDDIEELVYKVKQIGEAWKQHEAKIKGKKAKSRRHEFQDRSPPMEDFIDAFQKFKYSLILLGKLRPHIQNPSAADLVHYLIMPLSLLVKCTRGPQQASVVVHPLMTSESVELLRSCLTAKEAEFWHSLGPAWTLSRSNPHWTDKPTGHYEPKFRSGWVPPEIVGSGRSVPADVGAAVAANAAARAADQAKKVDREDPLNNPTVLVAAAKFKSSTGSSEPKSPTGSPSKGAIFKRVKAIYSFTGKNPKELSVNQGEEVMILDDSRQWWCVRNSSGAVGFVPNTILNGPDSVGSSIPSLPSSATIPTTHIHTTNGHLRRQGSSSSDSSSAPVFSNQSSLSQEGFSKLNNKPESPKVNGGASFESMISSKADSLKKVVDIPDGPKERKRLSSADLLNNELRNKISSDNLLNPVSISRSNSQESAIILRNQSTASDVQHWMQSKNFSNEAMDAVKLFSAEELSMLTRNDISHLVGDSEGKKLYTQLSIEKSGDCWHQIVVHRGVSELQAVMNRRKNLSDGDDASEDIRRIVRAAQSDRHDTWIERKLTKRPSLENLQDAHDKRATDAELTRQSSYELRRKPEQPSPSKPAIPPPTVPRVAPKPRPHTIAAPPLPVEQSASSQFTGLPPAPVLNPNDHQVDDLLREHQRQQVLLQDQQRQLSELRSQQKQKEEIMKYEENRIRLEQQVKDQEAMLQLMQNQQRLSQAAPRGQANIATIQPNIAGTVQPQGTYLSYVPVQAMPGMQIPSVQGFQAAQPIYTIPQVYGAMPPTLAYHPK